jgi:hypothetical protein
MALDALSAKQNAPLGPGSFSFVAIMEEKNNSAVSDKPTSNYCQEKNAENLPKIFFLMPSSP